MEVGLREEEELTTPKEELNCEHMPDFYYQLIIYPLIYVFPAYVANGAPVIFGGGLPIDLNKKISGKPIFGSHKTIRGLVAGLLAGFILAYFESIFIPYMLVVGILLSIGTHFGDLLGSLIKRRIGTREGVSMPFLDQYLFLLFAFIFSFPLGNLPSWYGILFIVILTGLLHKGTNIAAYLMKLKKVPW